MNAEAKMQPHPFDQLRSSLNGTLRNHDFLAEYIATLNQDGNEEDIFYRLAFRGADFGGEALLALYEGMSVEDQTELRRWWHEKARREAYYYDDLRARLSWRYLV